MYRVNNKTANIRELNGYMLAKTLGMFEYTNLPPTLPAVELEKHLQTKGYSFVTEVNGSLYALYGGLGGVPDAYGNPTEINLSNPYLKFNATLNLSGDGVLILNDSMFMGLYPIFDRFNTLLVENYITMDINGFNSRLTKVLSASDDRTRESADRFVKKLRDGEPTVIGEHALFDGVTVHGSGTSSSPALTSLIEYHQYLRACLYNEVGIDLPYNMKRERLNTSEVEQDTNSISVLTDNMLECRREAVENINEKYSLDITVDLSGVWRREKKISGSTLESAENDIVEMEEEGLEEKEEVEEVDINEEEEMQHITIRKYLEGEDLWTEIGQIGNFPFVDSDTNRLFIIEYGSLPLFSGIENESVGDLAKFIVNLYEEKWNSILELSGIPIDREHKNVVTEETTSTEERTSTRTDVDKVSAVNTETLVEEGGKDTEGLEGVEGEVTKTRTDEKSSAKSLTEGLSRLDKINITKVAFNDVANFMKIDIY